MDRDPRIRPEQAVAATAAVAAVAAVAEVVGATAVVLIHLSHHMISRVSLHYNMNNQRTDE